MTFLIILAIIALGVGAYIYRVPLIAKVTGQSPQRVENYLKKRKQLK